MNKHLFIIILITFILLTSGKISVAIKDKIDTKNITAEEYIEDTKLQPSILNDADKKRIKSEEIYRIEVRKQLEKTAIKLSLLNKIVKILNTPIAIWFLTTIVVGGITLLYNRLKTNKENKDKTWKLDREIASRLAYFEELIDQEKPKTFSEYHRFLSILRQDTPASRIFECFRGRTTSSMLLELSHRVSKKDRVPIISALDAIRTIARYNPHSEVSVKELTDKLAKLTINRWKQ